MNVKHSLANEKYRYPVVYYPIGITDSVRSFFDTTVSRATLVPLASAALETQQLDAHSKEQTIQELVAQIQEIQENKQDTGSPIGFLVDSHQIGQNDAETESTLIAAAHTALSESTTEVAVALIPLNEQEEDSDNEYIANEEIGEVKTNLESFGCKVFTDRKVLISYLNNI